MDRVIFKNGLIDIDIFKIGLINMDIRIFKKCRYNDNLHDLGVRFQPLFMTIDMAYCYIKHP